MVVACEGVTDAARTGGDPKVIRTGSERPRPAGAGARGRAGSSYGRAQDRRPIGSSMAPSPTTDPQVDAILRGLPPDLREIAGILRRMVTRNAPALRECVKWNNPFWVGAENAICLMVYPDHVNLGFFRGAELAKRHPEVEGTGKSLRHVKVPDAAFARRPVLAQIVRDAAALDRSRRR